MDEHVGAVHEPRRIGGIADVAAQFLDRALELGVIERSDVERADLAAVPSETAGEVQTEEARAAGDRPAHELETTRTAGPRAR